MDWDGNELLLSDILGTENDVVSTRLEEEVNRKLLYHALTKLSDREKQIMDMRFGLKTGREMTQKKWLMPWVFHRVTYRGWRKKIIERLQREVQKLG